MMNKNITLRLSGVLNTNDVRTLELLNKSFKNQNINPQSHAPQLAFTSSLHVHVAKLKHDKS